MHAGVTGIVHLCTQLPRIFIIELRSGCIGRAYLEVHVIGFALWAAVSNHDSDHARVGVLVAPPLNRCHIHNQTGLLRQAAEVSKSCCGMLVHLPNADRLRKARVALTVMPGNMHANGCHNESSVMQETEKLKIYRKLAIVLQALDLKALPAHTAADMNGSQSS